LKQLRSLNCLSSTVLRLIIKIENMESYKMSSNCRLVSLLKMKAGNEEMLSPKSEPQSGIESLIGEPNRKELNSKTFHKII